MLESLSPALIAAAVIGGYLLGSIPFGVIATRLGGAGDVRNIGSGNIGATNVLRTGRKDLAAITLLGDGGKGAVAVLLAWLATRESPKDVQALLTSIAAASAFLGHLFPVWLKFKGGKGVATFFGTLLAAAWPVGIAAGATWIVMAFLFRISSLAALAAVALAPIYAAFIFDRPLPVAWLALFMAVLVYFRHAENIRRLLKGEEPRIGGGKKDPA
ncbi:MAG: glycerol-3-phosphate 1-O-acyltransferase PlsY [Phenylobacterium sp.]|uniref:glycerol-3-phosphate 1-O-acyltransferase PlsY n=1 Tax=Phenylobacterium sp. TaxID=1871053 RepID=UPI001B55B6DE|nr:glycerol-3-phosphate 1-O-acyltransferase PlsY [Phenylobacterium sp.]MBP7815029.1 glycerol-3-phosphate 1-O-acyltransferase PlsY [Phenylobacterium sp.]MBP9231373.1 glycerol-3-phosphate 1-O-acyltransferase PlsY [Phenylobacterium sp.]MBP9755284.1 glycerol-3-phosphate 1-O-acyltransferase PlsY [Phenylobacterium sp.]